MKTLLSLVVIFIVCLGANNAPKQTVDELEATYNGLTEEMEFQFTDEEGDAYFFQEVEEGLSYDLYEEEFIGVKFSVTWEEREVEDDDDDAETASSITIKVITGLKKL